MRQTKQQLRQKFIRERAALPGDIRLLADRKISANFLAEFGGAGSYFIYHSFNAEADTSALISALLGCGRAVYLPRVEGDDMVTVPYGPLKEGRFGIPEPCGEAYRGDIEVTVAPLLAVGADGVRLGYGGGYYDRYFARANTLRVGIGYDFQFTEELFSEEWDMPLDAFVSESGVRRFVR